MISMAFFARKRRSFGLFLRYYVLSGYILMHLMLCCVMCCFNALFERRDGYAHRHAGGDQGLLNSFFANWAIGDASARLSFTYNMTANARCESASLAMCNRFASTASGCCI